MQFKSIRGVQQVDVSDAADALISDGLRPTIERVRQKMGRGSPNTVSPMLDAWFGALGARLTGYQSVTAADAIPGPVQEGMRKLWDMALASGREEAAGQVAQLQARLEDERIAIAAKATEFVQREQLHTERMQASEDALNAARIQIEDLRGQYADLRKSLKERETEVAGQRARLEAIEQAWTAQRRKDADDAAQQVRERERADERAASTERRLLQEVDRARQETKLLRLAALEFEKRNAAQQSQWEETLRTRSNELGLALEQNAQKSTELHAMQEALATAHLKTDEIKDLFDKQRLANESAIALLTRALVNRSRLATSALNPKNKGKLRNPVIRIRRP